MSTRTAAAGLAAALIATSAVTACAGAQDDTDLDQ
jgi:hypothetical protein